MLSRQIKGALIDARTPFVQLGLRTYRLEVRGADWKLHSVRLVLAFEGAGLGLTLDCELSDSSPGARARALREVLAHNARWHLVRASVTPSGRVLRLNHDLWLAGRPLSGAQVAQAVSCLLHAQAQLLPRLAVSAMLEGSLASTAQPDPSPGQVLQESGLLLAQETRVPWGQFDGAGWHGETPEG